MKNIKITIISCVFALFINSYAAKGEFINLDFEAANLATIPAGQSGPAVYVTNGMPGWRCFLGSQEINQIFQNQIAFGSANISIISPEWTWYSIIEGNYMALLQTGQGNMPLVDASISQIGIVPPDILSIYAKIAGEQFSIFLAGQEISLLPITSTGTGGYTLYAGDISQFAGQTAELKFTALTTAQRPYNGIYIDSIAFSPLPVPIIPEPSTMVILVLGGAVVLLFIRNRRRAGNSPMK